MSSSGLIYAVIVGAWAVYLVPMWLRREDELNRARETQRYAAAIKVLSNKEAFERRWAQSGEDTEELPIAVGQSAPAPVRTKPAKKSVSSLATVAAASVTAPTATRQDTKPSRTAPAPTPKAATSARRTGLMARRRRVVVLLFGLSTLGALVSADLGAAYLWAMAIPAALLSAYIVRLRRDERAKVAERVKRKAAADEARIRQARRAETEAKTKAETKAETERQARVAAELEAFERRQAQAAARRRTAAARSRAQSLTPQAQDSAARLRRASNG